MSDNTQEIPFLWRLSSQDEQGFCAVSMVVPVPTDDSDGVNEAHTIQTRVMSFADDLSEGDEDEVLEWNDEDLNLFLRLISTRVGDKAADGAGHGSESIKVDLSDPRIIEVVQIVAAAGFGVVMPGDEFLLTSDTALPSPYVDIGSHVSIHTVSGYKRCVVVDTNDDEAVCVMLDSVEAGFPGFLDEVKPYDLLLVKRHQLLDPQYASDAPVQTDVVH